MLLDEGLVVMGGIDCSLGIYNKNIMLPTTKIRVSHNYLLTLCHSLAEYVSSIKKSGHPFIVLQRLLNLSMLCLQTCP